MAKNVYCYQFKSKKELEKNSALFYVHLFCFVALAFSTIPNISERSDKYISNNNRETMNRIHKVHHAGSCMLHVRDIEVGYRDFVGLWCSHVQNDTHVRSVQFFWIKNDLLFSPSESINYPTQNDAYNRVLDHNLFCSWHLPPL